MNTNPCAVKVVGVILALASMVSIAAPTKNHVAVKAAAVFVKGDKGDTGSKGDRGDIGPQGQSGPQGASGNPGRQGIPGPADPPGKLGDVGPARPLGEVDICSTADLDGKWDFTNNTGASFVSYDVVGNARILHTDMGNLAMQMDMESFVVNCKVTGFIKSGFIVSATPDGIGTTMPFTVYFEGILNADRTQLFLHVTSTRGSSVINAAPYIPDFGYALFKSNELGAGPTL